MITLVRFRECIRIEIETIKYENLNSLCRDIHG